MLTTILVLEAAPLAKSGYLVTYMRANQDRRYKAIISPKLYYSNQFHRGHTFRAEITKPFTSNAKIVSLSMIPLPIEFYPAALNLRCNDISLLDDRVQMNKKLEFLSRFPQRLSRLLDADSPDFLESAVGLYNAYKIHSAWNLGKSQEHRSTGKLSTNFNTKGSLTISRKVLQLLLHKRNQEVSILTSVDICQNLNIDTPTLAKALNTLALYRTIIPHPDYIMLTGEFFLQNKIRTHLQNKLSDLQSSTFFSYEIDNALERTLLLLRVSIHTSYRMMLHNSINFKISFVCGLQSSHIKTIIPILSSLNDQLCGANIFVITASKSAYNGFLPSEAKIFGIDQLHQYTPSLFPPNTLILALDSDTYSNADLCVMFGHITNSTRLIMHSSQSNHSDIYFGKIFYTLIKQYPKTIFPQTALDSSQPTQQLTSFHSTKVSFNQNIEDIVRLVASSSAVGCTPSYGQAKKLNRLLQNRIAEPSNLIIDFNRHYFYKLDRVIFLASLPDYKINKFSYGTIIDSHESMIYIETDNSIIPISVQDFLTSKPELAYFLPMRYLKRIHIKEAIILTGNSREFVPFVTRAITRSKSYNVVYIRDFQITAEQILPFSERRVINVVPSVM